MHCTCKPMNPSQFIHIGTSIFATCDSCRVYWWLCQATTEAIDADIKALGGLDAATAEWCKRASEMMESYQPHDPPGDSDQPLEAVDATEIPF